MISHKNSDVHKVLCLASVAVPFQWFANCALRIEHFLPSDTAGWQFLPYVQHLSHSDKVRRLHQIVIIIGIIIGLDTVCTDKAN